MKVQRRQLARGTALVLASTLLFAGCAKGSQSADAAGEGAEGDAIALTFHTWIPTQTQWPELIAAFEKENPGISITFNREEDYDTYRTNLDNEILAGEVPDIYGIQVGSSFDDYAQYAKPVEEYGADWIGKIQEPAKKETTTADGVLAGVPVLMSSQEFYLYNKTLMDELGISLPTNYEELVAASRTATDAGYSPFAMGAADSWHDVDFFVWLSNQYGDGGDIYKAAAGEIPWSSPSLVSAATAWQKLFSDGVFQKAALTTTTYPSARDDFFLARKAIAMPTGSWHVGMSMVGPDQEQPGSAAEKDEIGMAVFPTLGEKDAGVTTGVDFALALSDELEGEELEAAAKFAEFLATGTGQQLWVNTLQGFPASTEVSIEVGDDEPTIAKESIKLVEDAIASATYARKLNVPGWDSLQEDLGAVLQKIAGGSDPKTELETLTRD
ncbi:MULTISPECIES: ABC transporter substrate-binding protein [Schaalia]|uniref:ABC transporter substrate-binding protein n=1 Tax=Schaalia TaxID=2529408 RepID=UPI0023F6E45C|nr:ABC transporter substrate-binding protein [Schaalia hyovaginalis]MCI7672213.1 ABC transporter substrate-binding protein [Schaalia hyovaginalis]MDY5505991.1 ABC transporter substrate-binding protein [Schaalia hyovaginalis]